METYDCDGDFAAAFPSDVPIHPDLMPFFEWLSPKPWGSVGYFYAVPGNADDLVPAEVSVDSDFAMVLRTPDGGQAGFWLAETRNIEEAPFAVFSSEGELNLVAPNWPCFLQRLASQDWDEYGASADFLIEEDEEDEWSEADEEAAPNLTAELSGWIEAQPRLRQVIQDTRMSPREIELQLDDGRPQRWLDEKVDAAELALDKDPTRAAIAQALRDGGIKHGAFRVFAAGDQVIVRSGMAIIEGPDNRLKKVAPSLEESLRPHLLALRQSLAESKPGFGLWTSATLMVTAKGRVDLDPSPDHELTIGNDAFPAKLFALDQERFPRKPSLMMPWLRELIDGASSE